MLVAIAYMGDLQRAGAVQRIMSGPGIVVSIRGIAASKIAKSSWNCAQSLGDKALGTSPKSQYQEDITTSLE